MQGAQGNPGQAGTPGTQGTKGEKGNKGAAGPHGPAGPAVSNKYHDRRSLQFICKLDNQIHLAVLFCLHDKIVLAWCNMKEATVTSEFQSLTVQSDRDHGKWIPISYTTR